MDAWLGLCRSSPKTNVEYRLTDTHSSVRTDDELVVVDRELDRPERPIHVHEVSVESVECFSVDVVVQLYVHLPGLEPFRVRERFHHVDAE